MSAPADSIGSGPRTDAADPLRCDPKDPARCVVLRRREHDVRPQVDVSESLQQIAGAAFLHSAGAVHDEVLPKADLVDVLALDREDDPGIALDVAQLLPRVHVAADDVLAVESDPDAAQLRTAVGVERDEMDQRVGLEPGAGRRIEHGHGPSLARRAVVPHLGSPVPATLAW